jgi:hypothetical protein
MVKPRENRVPIMMSDEELKLVDDWRFKNRVATRSEAVRRLLQIGTIFDNNKIDLGTSLVDLHTKARALTEKISVIGNQENITSAEGDVLVAATEVVVSCAIIASVIKNITSIANNFSVEGDLAEIITEAKKLEGKYKEHYLNLVKLSKEDTSLD